MRKLLATVFGRVKNGDFVSKFVVVAPVCLLVDILFRLRPLSQGAALLIVPVLLTLLVIRSLVESLIITLIFQFVFNARRKD